MSLIKRGQRFGIKSLILVVGSSLDTIVVYADPTVGITYCHVKSKVVMQSVVGSEVELGELDVGDMELDLVGTEDEPKDENGQADDDDGGDDDVEEAFEETAATATAGATAGTVVVSCRWWD